MPVPPGVVSMLCLHNLHRKTDIYEAKTDIYEAREEILPLPQWAGALLLV